MCVTSSSAVVVELREKFGKSSKRLMLVVCQLTAFINVWYESSDVHLHVIYMVNRRRSHGSPFPEVLLDAHDYTLTGSRLINIVYLRRVKSERRVTFAD